MVASGSLPPGTPDDYYARVGRIAKDWNSKFVLDTSGLPLIAALAEGVYLCKPNLHELSELAGERLDDEAAWVRAAKGLVECGRTEVVALTLGDRGALLVTQDLVLRAQPLPITAVSAVGTGDSFLGAKTGCGRMPGKCFSIRVAAGSSALINPGTELCHAKDTHRLEADVVMRAL